MNSINRDQTLELGRPKMLGQIKRMRTSLEWAYELFFILFFIGKKGGLLMGEQKKKKKKKKPKKKSYIYMPLY